jgi:MFS family permease
MSTVANYISTVILLVMARRSLLADIRPLRESPAYRRFWVGSALSSVGNAMTTFAVALQVFRLTGSSVAVGAVGLATFVPALLFGVVGGALGDSVDRRRLVLITQFGLMAVSGLFAAQAFLELDRLWLLYLLVAIEATLGAINGPARRTFMPSLLPKEQIPAGSALAMLSMHSSVICGPLLAGLIVPVGGLKTCYLIDALSFVAALYGVFRLPPLRAEGGPLRPGLGSILDGFRFLGRSRVLTGVLLADVSATLLAMPIALFPAINAERFNGSPRTLGLLSAGLAVGGLVGTVFSGPVSHLRRQGLGVVVAGGVWGAALAGFGAVHSLSATLAFLVVAGIADVTSVMMRSTIVQLATPDAYRARINAAEITVGGGVPQLGNFRAGLVAEATSPGLSATVGGVAAVVGAVVVGLAFPALVRYTTRTEISEAQPARL